MLTQQPKFTPGLGSFAEDDRFFEKAALVE